jgi:hypothetical protein
MRLSKWLFGAVLSCVGIGTMSPALGNESSVNERIVAEADNTATQRIESIRLEMLVVHATTANKAVDPQVRPLMKYFRNYKFTGFSLLDSQNAKLTDNSARTFTIEGERTVTITMLSHTEKSAKLKLVIVEDKGKKILDTTVNINRNGTFIVAGPKFKEGVLFLPISAKY